MLIDELLPMFRKNLLTRTIFCSCLTLNMSAGRSLEFLYPFTSQRQPIRGHSRRSKRRYSDLVSGWWNGEHCCMVDRVTNAEKNRGLTRTLPQHWLIVLYGNGEAMWQEWTSTERHTLRECGTKEWTKEELGDRDPTGRQVQKRSRRTLVTSSQNMERIE